MPRKSFKVFAERRIESLRAPNPHFKLLYRVLNTAYFKGIDEPMREVAVLVSDAIDEKVLSEEEGKKLLKEFQEEVRKKEELAEYKSKLEASKTAKSQITPTAPTAPKKN